MNQVKKYLGVVWILIAVVAYSTLLITSIEQINQKPTVDTIIQWSIFAFVFFPIAIGLIVFGWLAASGAYDHLPKSSNEVEE
jgi:uncharacterized membrane protein